MCRKSFALFFPLRGKMSGGLNITLIYGSAQLVLGVVLALVLFIVSKQTGKSLKCQDFLIRLWKMRGVYTPLIIHIYDTATDIGVLYEWHILAKKEKEDNEFNIESLDMEQFFWIGIGFMIAYRCLLGIYGVITVKQTIDLEDGCCRFLLSVIVGFICFSLELGLFFVIFDDQQDAIENHREMVVNEILKAKEEEKKRKEKFKDKIEENKIVGDHEFEKMPIQCAGEGQKILQLIEAVLESLPEVILQTVFVIRSVNDPYLSEQESEDGSDVLILIMISIIASLISITNKYVWIDELMVIWQCKHLIKSKPFWKDNYNSILMFLNDIWEYPSGMEYLGARCVVFQLMKDYIKTHGKDNVLKQAQAECEKTGDINIYNYYDWSTMDKRNDDDFQDRVFKTTGLLDHKSIPGILYQHIQKYMTNEEFNKLLIIYLGEANTDWLYPTNKCQCKTTKKEYYLSYGYIIRVIWRLSAVIARFTILSLIWVVIGGAIEIVFIATAIYLWSIMILMYSGIKATMHTSYSTQTKCCFVLLIVVASFLCPILPFGFMLFVWYGHIRSSIEFDDRVAVCFFCCVLPFYLFGGVPLLLLCSTCVMVLQLGILFVSGSQLYIFRMIENVIVMSVITLFAFNDQISCNYCANKDDRSAFKNERIMIWIIIGWVSICIHIVSSYFVSKMIRNNYRWQWNKIIQIFVDEADDIMDQIHQK